MMSYHNFKIDPTQLLNKVTSVFNEEKQVVGDG